MKKKRNIILQAIATGFGLAVARLIIDIWIEPQPLHEVIQYATISFCVGFILTILFGMIGRAFRNKEREGIEQPLSPDWQAQKGPSEEK